MNYVIVSDNELCHHGIFGQKWGVRRYQNKNGGLTSSGKKRYVEKQSSDDRAKNSNKKRTKELESLSKNRKLLSDNTLQKKIQRLKLEKEFKDLVESDLNPGKKVAAEILGKIGKNVAVDVGTKFATGLLTYGTKNALTKEKFDGKELASFLIKDYKNKDEKK